MSSTRNTREASPPQGVSAEALIAFRGDMLRFARLQLRDADSAEDVVQEAIEAALGNARSFAGRSSFKTWVFAILRNKIIDHIHQRDRSIAFSALLGEGEDFDQKLDELFNERGHWTPQCRPARWPDPEDSMASRQFWAAFEVCLDCMPERIARVFMMREFLGLDTAEICGELGLKPGNLHVILHRARLRLRECLEAGWVRSGGRE
jgi:RNA polymerase sigma-70 factor, ECF subfamily